MPIPRSAAVTCDHSVPAPAYVAGALAEGGAPLTAETLAAASRHAPSLRPGRPFSPPPRRSAPNAPLRAACGRGCRTTALYFSSSSAWRSAGRGVRHPV
jgi:hypothetical protein